MTNSRRTDPRAIRAARRARFPTVRGRRPSRGRHHPASAEDVRQALRRFGDDSYYGLDSVELVPAPSDSRGLPFGTLASPGHILLYDQRRSPWRVGARLRSADRALLESAGATVESAGVVTWPDDRLRRFMLGYVLAHEIGHHVLQHERRLRGQHAARTREHEARADAIAAKLRPLLD